MTAVLSPMPSVPQPRAPAVLPDSAWDMPLTVTAHLVQPGVAVVAVSGEVDLFTSRHLTDALMACLRRTCRRLVVDLTEVSFFGAAGLTALLTAKQAATAVGADVCLVACTRVVLRPLEITELASAFDIRPHLAHALCRSGG